MSSSRESLRDTPRKIVYSVGTFLAYRQIRQSSKWTTGLIIAVMTLTFLNLVVVSGILVGLIEGSTRVIRERYNGDVVISTKEEKTYIENSQSIISIAREIPGVKAVSGRYVEGGTVEANYERKLRETDLSDEVGTLITGIDPIAEDAVTGLSQLVREGSFLDADDYDQVVLGGLLLQKYLDVKSPGLQTLDNVEVGDRVKITVNGNTREVTVKGITRTKADEVDRRVYFVDRQLRTMIGRTDFNVDEIVLRLFPDADPVIVKEALIARGVSEWALVQTFEDAEPKFLKDIKRTFETLGNFISSIGLAVASITIFIVVFINAITRRKSIGILKGVGVSGDAIEWAYVLQALFYAGVGSFLGLILLYGFLVPFFAAHPINFPFSDGILVAPPIGTTVRVVILFIATAIAGYIPARIVVRQNTLDAILGR